MCTGAAIATISCSDTLAAARSRAAPGPAGVAKLRMAKLIRRRSVHAATVDFAARPVALSA
jgi:hypothetical protein